MADDEKAGEGSSRRTMLKIGVGVIGGGLGLIPLAPAIGYVAFPLDHKVTSSGGGFLPCGKRKGFGAEPVKVDLFADQVDAWQRSKDVKIGSAWVIELDGNLTAFSTVCPHLGCAIDFDPSAKKFICPCHKSFFSLSGAVEEGPSPRALDALDVKEDGDLVTIRYARFRQGTDAKEEV
ncbi:MAG: Rieske (2Fe-2S) protein [Myxococcales bacterium]|nr:Rieske (2Fe-2S) protein [Myxococcales bacterium]MCA9659008.1 Rieske (2Fe-2S) protein [Myxococcales bacterium]MCB9701633.1 Rieske (2Fe-2S) protein [Myxococcales bacterium]